MKIVACDGQDALQHLVQIEGGEHGLAGIVQDRDFIHSSRRIVTWQRQLAEVPKVTKESALNEECALALLPPSCSANQPVGSQAEPEVHKQPQIELEPAVASEWKRGCQKEVRHIA